MADVVNVEPGEGTLARSLQAALPGAILRLAPGRYTGSVEIPSSITIEGSSVETTYIDGTGHASIIIKGDNCRISGVTIGGATQTRLGIETYFSMQIERCRFLNLQTGIWMMGAPLTDIVACDFVDCGVGIEAASESTCPTVWGCQFVGGRVGLDFTWGVPYIRNCVFWKQEIGLRFVTNGRSVNRTSICQSLFFGSSSKGMIITALPTDKLIISNNIFARCAVAAQLMPNATDCIRLSMFDEQSHVRDINGGKVSCIGERGNVGGKVGPLLADGELRYDDPTLVLPPVGEAGTCYGPESMWRIVGTRSKAALPPVRFRMEIPIVNSRIEEDAIVARKGLSRVGRTREILNGQSIDRVNCNGASGAIDLLFDVSRIEADTGK